MQNEGKLDITGCYCEKNFVAPLRYIYFCVGSTYNLLGGRLKIIYNSATFASLYDLNCPLSAIFFPPVAV